MTIDTSKSRFKLFDSAGTSLLYTFPAVITTNAPQSVRNTVEIQNFRSQASIVVDGGNAPWDLFMVFHVAGDDHEEVMAEVETLENAILLNVPYILRIYKTSSTFFEYKVKRLLPFQYENSLRLYLQQISATFRANSW